MQFNVAPSTFFHPVAGKDVLGRWNTRTITPGGTGQCTVEAHSSRFSLFHSAYVLGSKADDPAEVPHEGDAA